VGSDVRQVSRSRTTVRFGLLDRLASDVTVPFH
jgi:hypothetical protein